ncbi:hypothetical protein LINGRAHAP2_LOCUS29332, partial [Linum grandiflorum]
MVKVTVRREMHSLSIHINIHDTFRNFSLTTMPPRLTGLYHRSCEMTPSFSETLKVSRLNRPCWCCPRDAFCPCDASG